LAGIIFGTAAILTRSISGVSSLAIAAARLLIGFAFMGFLIGVQGHLAELKRSLDHAPTFLLLGVISSLHFLFFVLAVQKTLVANALILVNTAPILVLLLTPLLLNEAIVASDVLSMAITFLGAGIIVGFDKLSLRPDYLIGDLCALGSAGCYALYAVLARKLRALYSSPTIMFWFFGLGSVFLWIGGAIVQDRFFETPTKASFLFLLLLGILPTGIGHFAYNLSLKYLPAAKASTIVLLEPVAGTLFAFLLLHEIPPLIAILGVLIVLTGIGLASFPRRPVKPSGFS
jgi:drug/metabolite transporter (DMT)-like permease